MGAVGYQEWRRLLFVHWPFAPELIRPLVPPMLALDLFEGAAWVSLIPFVVQCARATRGPRSLRLAFLETNVRTYVHLAGHAPGVYFFSLDAASALAVIGARTTLGLPYMFARGNERRDGPEIDYELRRRAAGVPACHVRYTVSGPTSTARPGTLDFFLIERYLLHVRRGPSLWTVRVRHPAYPLQHVQLMELQQTLLEADGLPSPPGQLPPLAHFSPGVDVEVFPPTLQFPVCVVR